MGMSPTCGGVVWPTVSGQSDEISDCQAQRAVVLADASGELFHSFGRSITAPPPYEKYAPSTQFGSLPARGTEHAAHRVRAFQKWAEQRRLSSAT
eukprot:1457910-Alexandrium_andersonii.AAC.1